MTTAQPLFGIVWFLLLCSTAFGQRPLDLEPEHLQPGLVAEYRSASEADAIIRRIDAKPAFHLGHSSPHPRIPPGPFEVVWTGIIHLQDSAPISFSAYCGGELTVAIDGDAVLRDRGETDTSELKSTEPLKRESGFYRVTIRYRSNKNVPARLQLFWESRTFAREPIPAWRFHHVATDVSADAQKSTAEATGRVLAGRYGCARCHSDAFPGVTDPPPGPSLAAKKSTSVR